MTDYDDTYGDGPQEPRREVEPEPLCWHCRREPAEKRHVPCCSSHGKPLCCACYCRLHFVEVNPCNSARHTEQAAS